MAMTLDKPITDLSLDISQDASTHMGTPPAPPDSRGSKSGVAVTTTRFGTLEIDEELVLTFPDGLIGFEHCKRFIVVRPDDQSPFRWFQSLEEPSVAFPIVEPAYFRSDYAPTIADTDARFLQLQADTPALLFAIVTVPRQNPREMTANLLGPLVINALTRQGKQVIVQNPEYITRHRVMEELSCKAEVRIEAKPKQAVRAA